MNKLLISLVLIACLQAANVRKHHTGIKKSVDSNEISGNELNSNQGSFVAVNNEVKAKKNKIAKTETLENQEQQSSYQAVVADDRARSKDEWIEKLSNDVQTIKLNIKTQLEKDNISFIEYENVVADERPRSKDEWVQKLSNDVQTIKANIKAQLEQDKIAFVEENVIADNKSRSKDEWVQKLSNDVQTIKVNIKAQLERDNISFVEYQSVIADDKPRSQQEWIEKIANDVQTIKMNIKEQTNPQVFVQKSELVSALFDEPKQTNQQKWSKKLKQDIEEIKKEDFSTLLDPKPTKEE